MAVFHVFVEGATDDSPGGLERLAGAIAKHYGLGAADLLARLQKGRFRVKGNADRATADTYVRDLARLGARCVIEEAKPAAGSPNAPHLSISPPMGAPTPPRASPVPPGATPPPTGNTPASALSAAGPRDSVPPPMSALAAAGARASTPPPMGGGAAQFQSGLSAAFSGELPAADLGALDTGADSGFFSLSSLDGVEDNSESGGSIGPVPSAALPASIGPSPEKPKSTKIAKLAKPADEPLDMFKPPEMQGDEFKVDIASDEEDFSARKRVSTPPPMETVPDSSTKGTSQRTPTAPAQRISKPSLQAPNVPVTSLPSKAGPFGDERVRFAAGVLLAVLLGFVPAHFIAKMKEDSAAATIDRKVITAQQVADTPEVYANLDRMRADQLDRKKSEHRNAAIIGFAIWALAGGGIAFAWFKKIPWDA